MFGKGGDAAPPPPAIPDNSGQMADMMNMMQGMMGGIMEGMMGQMMGITQQMQGMTQSMLSQASDSQESMMATLNATMPTLPEAYRDPEIDWTEKQQQLSAKAKADYNLDTALRKGRMDTILTSPLLDDEEANVGGSVLSGE